MNLPAIVEFENDRVRRRVTVDRVGPELQCRAVEVLAKPGVALSSEDFRQIGMGDLPAARLIVMRAGEGRLVS